MSHYDEFYEEENRQWQEARLLWENEFRETPEYKEMKALQDAAKEESPALYAYLMKYFLMHRESRYDRWPDMR